MKVRLAGAFSGAMFASIATAALIVPLQAAAQGKEIRIAHVYSKTGPLEAYGKQTQTGLMMGLDYATNGTMMVAGKKIVLIEKDDQGKPDVGKSLLAAAYGDDKADIAVGPTASPVALAMLPVAEEYKKVLLVEQAVADSITGDKWNKYIFRTGRNSSQDAISNAVAQDKAGTSIATLAQDYAFEARRNFVSQPGDFDPQKFNPDFPYELTTDTASTTLGGILPYGLSYDLSALTGEKKAITDFRASPEDAVLFPQGLRATNNYFAETYATARQHLLKDFWIDQNQLNLIVSRKNLQVSQQALRFQIMRTVFAVEIAYYDLAALRESIRVQERAVELKRQLVSEIHRRVQVGDLPGLDAEQAETELENSLTALLTAREEFTSQQNVLKSLLTDDFLQLAEVDIEPIDGLAAVPPTVNRSESFQRALKNRPDLIEARLGVEKSQSLVRFRMNQLLPALDLVGRYGGQGVATSSSAASVV
jgi:hypothetical protein